MRSGPGECRYVAHLRVPLQADVDHVNEPKDMADLFQASIQRRHSETLAQREVRGDVDMSCGGQRHVVVRRPGGATEAAQDPIERPMINH